MLESMGLSILDMAGSSKQLRCVGNDLDMWEFD